MFRSFNNALWRSILCGAAISASTLINIPRVAAQETGNALGGFVYEHEGVPLIGYISDPKVSEAAQEIVDRYLGASSNKYGLVRAVSFIVFIDPEIVSEGKFLKPVDLELTDEMTEPFAKHELSNEGCNVGRIDSTNEDVKGEYLVWLIHGGEFEGVDGIKSCLLFAAAAAAGVGLKGFPKMETDDLRQVLDALILGVR